MLLFALVALAAAAEDAAQETATRTERMSADENRVGAEVRAELPCPLLESA